MRRWSKILVGGIGALCLLIGGLAWLQRGSLLTWYYVRGLEKAGDGERVIWVERVASLDQAAVPGLLRLLNRDDARICENAVAALEQLVGQGPPDQARLEGLVRPLVDGFRERSHPGQQQTLRLALRWLRGEDGSAVSGEVARALAPLLPQAAASPAQDIRTAALDLAGLLMARPDGLEFLHHCRELAKACLGDTQGENRARAVQLSLNPGMDLQRYLLPLLRDPEAEVRRLALLALGPAQDVIVSEELLRWLHDPDPEVRRLCETALRGRKLSENHIQLGRLLTADKAQVRLQVLDHLRKATDLDPGVWLRYLSQDPVPSVRVAAMRAASTQAFVHVPFHDRLEQMCSDPNPSVSQLAQFYLLEKKRLQE